MADHIQEVEEHLRQIVQRALDAPAPARVHVDTEQRAKIVLEAIRRSSPKKKAPEGDLPPEKTRKFSGQN